MKEHSGILRISALLLSGVMAFGGLSVAASAEAAVDTVRTYSAEELLPDGADLLEGYLRSQAGIEDAAGKLPSSSGREALGKVEQAIYDMLSEKIVQIANGELTTTQFDLSEKELRAVVGQSTNIYYWDLHSVMFALLLDHPYELYWYDKTYGIVVSGLNFRLAVSVDYSLTGKANSTKTDPDKIAAVQTSVNTAKGIVNSVDKNWSDYHALRYFKEKICELTSYNDDAVAPENEVKYGDPWQLIHVFDNNPNTKVVCEGYSKAFKFLCDMYKFNSTISCEIVSGKVSTSWSGPSSSGLHMWNHVYIGEGANRAIYLVDVTNSDTGTIGEGGELFFVGADVGKRTTDSSGRLINYTIDITPYAHIYFEYDEDTLSMYSSADLDVSRIPPTLHTVVWKNDKGKILETDEIVANGERPVYNGKTPSSSGKVFKGWSPQITLVPLNEETITYTAVFEDAVSVDTVRVDFVMPVSYLSDFSMVEKGTKAEVPDRLNMDIGEFVGWFTDPDFTEQFDLTKPVTKDTKLYAGFKSTTSWYDDNGTLLYSTDHWFGDYEGLTYPYDDPVKDSTVSCVYKFKEWEADEKSDLTGGMTYRAVYDEMPRKYVVSWMCNGEIIATDDVPYGEYPEYHGELPTKPDDEDVSYVFDGWGRLMQPVKGDATYVAHFKEVSKTSKYVVRWKNYNGAVLQTSQVMLGETVEYSGEEPTRPSDDLYDYTFNGFDKISDTEYVARYEAKKRKVIVSWYNWNGELLDSATIFVDEEPVYTKETPEKPSDEKFDYVFNGWKKDQTGESIVFTAQFEAKKIEKDLPKRIFGDVNNDGAVDSSDALVLLRASVGLVDLSPVDLYFGDVDGNGVIDSADAITTLRYSVGYIDIAKIGELITVPDDL